MAPSTSTTTSINFQPLSLLEYKIIDAIIQKLPNDAHDMPDIVLTYRTILPEFQLSVDEDSGIYMLLLQLTEVIGMNYKQKWQNVLDDFEERGINFVETPPRRNGKGLKGLKEQMDKVTLPPRHTITPSIQSNPPISTLQPRTFPSTSTRPPKSIQLQSKTRPFLINPPLNAINTSSEDEHQYQTPLQRQSRRDEITRKSSFLPPHINSVTPSRIRSARLEVIDDPALVHKADTFRKLAILDNYFRCWMKNFQRIQLLNRQAIEFDRLKTLRKMMLIWNGKRLERNQRLVKLDKLCSNLLSKKNKELKRGGFALWREELEHRLIRRDTAAKLSGAFKALSDNWKNRALSEYFAHWHRKKQSRQAISFHQSNLARSVLSHWSHRLQHVNDMVRTADDVVANRNASTLYTTFHLWNKLIELRLRLKQSLDVSSEVVKSDHLTIWIEQFQLVRTAREFREESLKSLVIQKWKRRMSRIRRLEDKCDDFHLLQNRTVASRALNIWRRATIGKTLIRSKSQELVKKSLGDWLERWTKIAIDGNALAAAFSTHSDNKLLSTYFSTWMTNLSWRKELNLMAEKVANNTNKRNSLNNWLKKRDERIILAKKAEIAGNYFLQRQIFTKWISAVAKRKRQRWSDARDRKLLAANFNVWKEMLLERKEESRSIEGFKKSSDLALQQTVITRWTTRVIEIKEREVAVTKSRQQAVLGIHLQKWIGKCVAHGEDTILADTFKELKREELLLRIFQDWSQKTKHLKLLENKLSQFLLIKEEVLVENIWDEWREKFGESILKEPEKELEIYVKEKLIERVFGKWKAKTLNLPAIQFYNENTRKRVFNQWRENLPKQLLLKQAINYDLKITAGHAFLIWHMKSRSRSAVRAASRFRALACQALPLRSPNTGQRLSRHHRSQSSITSTPTPIIIELITKSPEEIEEESKALMDSLSYSPTPVESAPTQPTSSLLTTTPSRIAPIITSNRTTRLSSTRISTPTPISSSTETSCSSTSGRTIKETTISTPITSSLINNSEGEGGGEEEKVISVSTIRDGIRARLAAAAVARIESKK